MKILSVVLSIVLLSVCFVSCGFKEDGKNRDEKYTKRYDTDNTGEGENIRMYLVIEEIGSMKVEDFKECDSKTDFILIKIKDYGSIVAVLREDVAPITVEKIKSLVESGFYNGTIFHRVIEGFMIQGGGYEVREGKWIEKYTESIKGEFGTNGVINNLCHARGVLSMARTNVPDSASSQFFIMHADTSSLDNKYAAFGYVLAGMDVVDAIATCEVDSSDPNSPKPVKDIVIESVTFVKVKK